ncbi:MAG: hypothetical protein JSS02_00080 [Planctomycetes bacterium]|nr:hypothetical protein [Planctomycetota bacterium]
MKSLRSTAHLLDAGLGAARRIYAALAVLLLVVFLGSGITIVAPGEVAIVRRLGKWIRHDGAVAVNLPGLLFAWPEPIDEVVRLPIKQEQVVPINEFWDESAIAADGTAANDSDQMVAAPGGPAPIRYALTGDRNVIQLKGVARYRISSPDVYATASQDPRAAVRKIVISAMTTTLNGWSVDDVLRLHRDTETLSDAVLVAARNRVATTDLGIELTVIEFGEVAPPAPTRQAFFSVHEARVEQDTWREEASMERAERMLTSETLAQQFIADARGKQSSRGASASRDLALYEAALAAREGALGDVAQARLRHEAWRELVRQAKSVWYVPKSAPNGIVRLPLPEPEKSR